MFYQFEKKRINNDNNTIWPPLNNPLKIDNLFNLIKIFSMDVVPIILNDML
jgi:hypothetical protein